MPYVLTNTFVEEQSVFVVHEEMMGTPDPGNI